MNLNSRFATRGALLFIALAYVSLATWANVDLLQNPAFLFSDEQMVYEYVRQLYMPGSAGNFFYQLADGGDHRYGRLFFNLSGLLALPTGWRGPSGLIFGIRTAQVALLLAAYVLGVFAMLRDAWTRVAALAVLVALPATAYFSVLPKPEATL